MDKVKKADTWKFLLILLLGTFLRFLFLGIYPMGVHQDEVYSGYEAFALLNEGVDSHGYRNPVYFISWGHGMNALYAYLTIPFIKLFGYTMLSIRLPQAILGTMTLVVFYDFLKRMKDAQTAFWGMTFLAINPWHIMLCRWGLEANLVPFFLLLATYFLIRAYTEHDKFYIPAFFCYGLTLYCYAIMWLFVPIFLLFLLIYGLYYKRVRMNSYLIIGLSILVIVGLPLVLFFLINQGLLSEICTEWISIPKMDSMRAKEVSLSNIKENCKSLLQVLVLQKDNMAHNSPSVGIYYYGMIPFMIGGGIAGLVLFLRNLREKRFAIADVMVLWMITAVGVGLMVTNVNVNRINCIHLAVIYFGTYGWVIFWRKTKEILKEKIRINNIVKSVMVTFWAISFLFFCKEYYSEEEIHFYYGFEDALDYAEEITEGDIGTVLIRYPLLFMHAEMLPSVYVEELNYVKNYDTVDKIGRYIIEPKTDEMEQDVVYVVPKYLEEEYLTDGFEVVFDNDHYLVLEYNEN